MSERSIGDKDHPGWKLSRECIQDTLIAKRTGVMKQGGLPAALCSRNLQLLRDTQLATHREFSMTKSRYLEKYLAKKYAPNIVIVVRGGLIQAVYSTNHRTQVFIADYDLHDPSEEEIEMRESAEERVAQGDMYELYW